MATLRATLYGLPVVTDRVTNLAGQDPQLARELFIQHALVGGEWRTHHAFAKRNQQTLEAMHELEDRTRRRDLAVTPEQIFAFYDQRVPAKVVSVRHFDSWWRKAKARTPNLLDFTGEDFAVDVADADADFPTTWTSQSNDYQLEYLFEPGDARDGIEVGIELTDLPQADAGAFEWLVPGLRTELVTGLIKALPKNLRRNFAPASAHAERIAPTLDPAGAPLLEQLAQALSGITHVQAADFDVASLPDHLRFTIVVREDGTEIARGKDLAALKLQLAKPLEKTVLSAYADIEQAGLTAWPETGIPRQLDQGPATVWPALVDDGASVNVRVFATQAEQALAMVRGTTRLMSFTLPDPSARLVKSLPMTDALLLSTAKYSDAAALVRDAWLTAVDSLVLSHGGPAWDRAAFEMLYEKIRQDMVPRTEQILIQVLNALRTLARVDSGTGEAAEDIATQLSWLIYPGFVRDMGAHRLPRLTVYLAAVSRRAQSTKDAEPIYALEARFYEITQDLSETRRLSADVQHVRWALEELRISWFAQDLRTAMSVSEKKVAAMLDALAATIEVGIS